MTATAEKTKGNIVKIVGPVVDVQFPPQAENFPKINDALTVTGDADKDAAFVKYAAKNGLVNLKGHRSVGGMRASIYNAMPVEGVKKLVEVMKAFEKENA